MTGIASFHRTLINSDFKFGISQIGLWHLGGYHRKLTDPTMMWYNGSTYAVGYERSNTNNQVWLVKQTGFFIEAMKVGVGTDGPEPEQHPTPQLHIDKTNGNIYVIQNAFHVREFRVWKSIAPESIETTYVGSFDTDGSYLNTFDDSNINSMWYVTRAGDSSPANGYDQSILNVDLDNPSAYTDLLVTDTAYNSLNVRHYPAAAYFKGASTYRTVFIVHRHDGTPPNVYKLSIYLKRLDNNLIYTFDLSSSKDVVVDGVLTSAELEADYIFKGTDADKVFNNYEIWDSWQIGNELWVAYRGNGVTKIEKYAIGVSLVPVASLVMPYDTYVRMYDNGDRWVLALQTNDDKAELWTVDYDLTNLIFRKALGGLASAEYYGLPKNLDDVDGKYLIIGRSYQGFFGRVPYYITKKTYKD